MPDSTSDSRWPLETRAFCLGAAAALVVWLLWPHLLSAGNQLVLLVVGVALLGLPHGAVDPLRAWNSGICHNRGTLLLFHALYLVVAMLVLLLWILSPAVFLALFLAGSAWHFGDDWRGRLPYQGRLAVGLAIICLPVGANPPEAAALFQLLAGVRGGDLAGAITPLAGPVAALALLVAGYCAWRKDTRSAVEIAVVVIAGCLLPPLLFFLVYFCLLHNGRHLLGDYATTSREARPLFVKVAAGYTLLALALVGMSLLHRETVHWERLAPQAVFVGLAALTFPHMLLSLLIHRRSLSMTG